MNLYFMELGQSNLSCLGLFLNNKFILGKKMVVMSVKDFYNACTPWSTLTHGVGRGTYTLLNTDEITSAKTYEVEKLPPKPDGRYSLLNEVNENMFIVCIHLA